MTWTFDDENGNTINVNQNVIVDDTTDPETPTLADVNVGQCSGTPPTPTTTDNCAGTINGTTSTSFPITAQGTTVVTWTFNDGNGNSINVNQNVIVDDTTDPICNAIGITVTLDSMGNATITGADIDNGSSDNCGIASLSASPNTFNSSNLGPNNVTLTVTDTNGNSTNCNVVVTVEDNALNNPDEEIVDIRIYPNPFNDNLKISLPQEYFGNLMNIEIFDLRGRLIHRLAKEVTSTTIQFNEFSNLEEGPYFIKITDQVSKRSAFKQLIKK